ncbi:hypothetical protein E2C01_007018 [Portunus trituberculatus]|uniref:Uncharacterized protein n=1 Tax=Portunus trituberculatus TaxID=210409 RepID=A0A5B7D190_PORTR|nr:hypothetical protein [Portunus trituberculatus]
MEFTPGYHHCPSHQPLLADPDSQKDHWLGVVNSCKPSFETNHQLIHLIAISKLRFNTSESVCGRGGQPDSASQNCSALMS